MLPRRNEGFQLTWHPGPQGVVQGLAIMSGMYRMGDHSGTHGHNTDLAQHLEFLVIPNIRYPSNERVLPSIELDAMKDVSARSLWETGQMRTSGCWQAGQT